MRSTVSRLAMPALAVAVLAGAASAQDFERPGKEHELLKKDVGVWKASMKHRMPGSDTLQPMGAGKETNRLLGNGMWLVGDFTGSAMGQPFHGHSLTGYDNEKGKYVAVWTDTLSSRMTPMEGTVEKGTLTMYSEGVDPVTGQKQRAKQVTAYQGDDKRTFRMYSAPLGSDDWTLSFQIDYERMKDEPKADAAD